MKVAVALHLAHQARFPIQIGEHGGLDTALSVIGAQPLVVGVGRKPLPAVLER